LAEILVELTGAGSEISYGPPRAGDIKDSYGDISKAQKLLGYAPKISLRAGLQTMVKEKKAAA
jgi:UDP-N-acetylglucosamine 4-epimerase